MTAKTSALQPPVKPPHNEDDSEELVLIEEGRRAKQAKRPQGTTSPQPLQPSLLHYTGREVDKESSISLLWAEEPNWW